MSVFDEKSTAVLECLLAGVSVPETARRHGVGERTIASWLEKGRRDLEGVYGAFARSVDDRRRERELPRPEELGELDEDELRRVVARSARAGNVQAARFYFDTWLKGKREEVSPDEFDPLAEVDELARRRAARGG